MLCYTRALRVIDALVVVRDFVEVLSRIFTVYLRPPILLLSYHLFDSLCRPGTMVDTEMTDAEREQARAQQGQGTLPAAASASGSGVNSDVMAAINKLGELGFAVKSLAEKVSAPTVPVGGSQDTGLANVKNFWSRPPLFTGENPEKEDVRTWLRLVGRMVAPLTNSSQGKADFVAGCLRGNAQSLYETRLEHLKPSFEELSAFLIKEFAEKNPEHHARLRLKHLRMKEGNLSAFKAEFTRNLSLCEKKPVHDADAIEYFYAGLTPELQNLLLMDPLTKEWWADLNTLMDAATLLYSQRGIKGKAVLFGKPCGCHVQC